jgi:hypothetical protein
MTGDRQQGRIHPVLAVVLAIVAVVLMIMMMKGCVQGLTSVLWGHHGSGWPLGWGWSGGGILPLGLWGVIQIVLSVWVGADAQKRGMHGLLWGLLVFFTGIVGLIVYLIVAPGLAQRNGSAQAPGVAAAAGTAPRCGKCGAAVQPEFKACPYCGAPMRCPHCNQAIQPGWKVCPYCTGQL